MDHSVPCIGRGRQHDSDDPIEIDSCQNVVRIFVGERLEDIERAHPIATAIYLVDPIPVMDELHRRRRDAKFIRAIETSLDRAVEIARGQNLQAPRLASPGSIKRQDATAWQGRCYLLWLPVSLNIPIAPEVERANELMAELEGRRIRQVTVAHVREASTGSAFGGESVKSGSSDAADPIKGRSSAVLAERKCQQARAQQHQAGRGQCEKSAGDQIVVTHDTPATSDAGPNLLKLSESPGRYAVMRLLGRNCPQTFQIRTSGPGTITLERMGQENPRAHQAHNRRNRLNHRKIPLRPASPPNG
jgi:hypothetical protein